MLYFLVPLRAKGISKNWNIEMNCLKNTIESVFDQSVDEYRVVLVCHDVPEFLNMEKPMLKVIKVNTPIPKNSVDQMKDKIIKKKIGLEYIMSKVDENTFVMLLDSDDIVCKYLASFCNDNRNMGGWYIANGYRYSYTTGKVLPCRPILGVGRFDYLCGSSIIVKLNTATFNVLLGSHRYIAKECKKIGYPLKPLPFYGAVYVLETGSNWSDGSYKNIIHKIKIHVYDVVMKIINNLCRTDYDSFPVLKRLLSTHTK